MKKKLACFAMTIVMIGTTLLMGCSGSVKTNSTDSTGDTKTDKTADSTAQSEDSSSGSSEPVTIKFQTWNPGDGASWDELQADFEAKNPDIKIDYVYMPYSDHIEKLKVDLASGQAADVFGMQTGATIKEFRDFEMDLTSKAEESWGSDWQSGYLDFCMKLLNEDGHFYGLPLGLTYAGFAWADVNMLSKYGLSVPKSLDDLVKVSKTLRDNGQYPLAIGAKDAWINIDTWMNIANDINSEKLYSAIEGKTSFEDPDLVKSFEIWQSLFTNGVFQDGAFGVNMYSDTTDLFQKEGSIPMLLNGSWAGGVYVSGDPDEAKVFNGDGANHDVFLIDWNNDGKPAPATASVDVSLCINKDTKNADAAWRFLDYMLHDGQDILVNKYFTYCPSRTDLKLNVEGMSQDGLDNLTYICDQAENNLGGYREMAYPELKQKISDTLTALALDSTKPEEAAKDVEAASKAQAR